MKTTDNSLRGKIFGLCVALGVMICQVSQVGAVVYTLKDVNSKVLIDPQTQAGMHNWIVDDCSVAMQKQWFWYRLGWGGPETSLDVLPFLGPVLTDRNPFTDPAWDTFAIKYLGPGFDLEFTTSLLGGNWGSGRADIVEQIRISNTSPGPIEFHFFQYADFDLGQPFIPNKAIPVADDDRVIIKLDPVTGLPTEVVQWDPTIRVSEAVRIQEAVLTPDANLAEAAFFPMTLVMLNDPGSYNLNNALAAGPGDVTWAFQWIFTIDPGKSVLISKDKIVLIPEPPAWALGALALLGFGVVRGWAGRRR